MATVYTSAGEAKVVDLTDGVSAVHLDATNAKVAWGTGAGTAAKADTTLFTEASEARVVPTVSQPVADKNRWVGTLTADAAKTITNAGLFDAATAGNLVIHGDHAGQLLALGDKIEYTIDLEQT